MVPIERSAPFLATEPSMVRDADRHLFDDQSSRAEGRRGMQTTPAVPTPCCARRRLCMGLPRRGSPRVHPAVVWVRAGVAGRGSSALVCLGRASGIGGSRGIRIEFRGGPEIAHPRSRVGIRRVSPGDSRNRVRAAAALPIRGRIAAGTAMRSPSRGGVARRARVLTVPGHGTQHQR